MTFAGENQVLSSAPEWSVLKAYSRMSSECAVYSTDMHGVQRQLYTVQEGGWTGTNVFNGLSGSMGW